MRPGPSPGGQLPARPIQQLVRREPLRLAAASAGLPGLDSERIELWPRDTAPGYYDAIMAACRAAGFGPVLGEHAAGSVWGFIAQGRGVGLVVSSLAEQLPRGIRLLDLALPQPPPLAITAVCRAEPPFPALRRLLEASSQLSSEQGWI